MTTGWGADRWEAPGAAWALARDTAAGRQRAARDIPAAARPQVLIALGAQVRSFLSDAAMRGVTWQPEPRAWARDVPHAAVRELAAASLSGGPVRVPVRPCGPCTAAALCKMADALLDVMTAAGVPSWALQDTLEWLAARAR